MTGISAHDLLNMGFAIGLRWAGGYPRQAGTIHFYVLITADVRFDANQRTTADDIIRD